MTTRAVGHISLGLRRQRRSPRSSLAGVGVTLRPATTSYTNGNLTAATDDVSFAYDTADRTTSITPAGGVPATFAYRGAGAG